MECVLGDSTGSGLSETYARFPPDFTPVLILLYVFSLWSILTVSVTICCESFKWITECVLGTPTTARHQVPKVLVAWVVYLEKQWKILLPQNVSLSLLAMPLPPNSQKVRFSRPLCKLGGIHDLQACPESWEDPTSCWEVDARSQLGSHTANWLPFPVRQQSQWILVPHWNYKLLWTRTSRVSYVHLKF